MQATNNTFLASRDAYLNQDQLCVDDCPVALLLQVAEEACNMVRTQAMKSKAISCILTVT